MIYKTLHWYVLRELLRVFLLTASALTTLMAFCGTFKPLAREGVEVIQLLKIMSNLMPAMLAYAIPIAALFAAVLVYWRLSTDNELTACRASGVSFASLLIPALVLGVAVACVDLVFVNFVVPAFWQKTETLVRKDFGSLLAGAIDRQEAFRDPNKKIELYANRAELLKTDDPNVQKVQLTGVVGAKLGKDGNPQIIASAPTATVVLKSVGDDETELTIENTPVSQAIDASNPDSHESIRGNFNDLAPPGWSYSIPSAFRDKPKFSNLFQLRNLNEEPWKFGPVRDKFNDLRELMRHQKVSEQLQVIFAGNKSAEFETSENRSYVVSVAAVTRTGATLHFDKAAAGAAVAGVKVQLYELEEKAPAGSPKVLVREWTSQAGEMEFTSDEITPVRATLTLHGGVLMQNRPGNFRAKEQPDGFDFQNLILPAEVVVPPALVGNSGADLKRDWHETLELAKAKDASAEVRDLRKKTVDAMAELDHTISSELHSRGSFAVSCLMLVLFGAALGVMLKGRNPLAVFVMGFIPSVLLVLLITMGRRVMESAHGNQGLGLGLLWAGNVILVMLVVAVYSKLLRT